jgi:hypothetical protein
MLTIAPVDGVNIACASFSTIPIQGFYLIKVPSGQSCIGFTHVSLKLLFTVLLKANEDYEFNLVMNGQTEQMGEIIVNSNNKKK